MFCFGYRESILNCAVSVHTKDNFKDYIVDGKTIEISIVGLADWHVVGILLPIVVMSSHFSFLT